MIRVIGNHVSPYARKVFLALDLKGVDYEVDPIAPFRGTEAFTAMNPLRRVPVLIDGDLVLSDSTVICEYLEDVRPDPPLLPRAPRDRARARWLEEFADTRLGDLLIWELFFQRVIRPLVFREDTDAALVQRTLNDDLPATLDWIESWAPVDSFLFGEPMLVDFTYAAMFRNAAIADWSPDATRWPRAAAWIDRVTALAPFQRTVAIEQAMLTMRGTEQRDALDRLGVRLAPESIGGAAPRRGVMMA